MHFRFGVIGMSGCKGCKLANDLKGCASSHATESLKLLAEGKVEEASKNLEGLKSHLNDK
jgi:hypothetical protein